MTDARVLTDSNPYGTAAHAASRLIATAFEDIPPTRWLVDADGLGDADGITEEQRRILRNYFLLKIQEALSDGNGYIDMIEGSMIEGTAAVAVWRTVSPTDQSRTPAANGEAQLKWACEQYTPRFHALDTAFAEHHPDAVSHEHLMFLATHPDHQGRGLGTTLLQHRLALLDQRGSDHRGAAVFLETTTPRNTQFYERVGFVVGEGPLAPYPAPDGETLVCPMWRDAQPA